MSTIPPQTEYIGLQERVLARVQECPGEPPRDLASYLEADYNSTTRALSRLNTSNRIFSIEGQYYPIFDDLDGLVANAFHLEQVKFKSVPAWRRWWKRLGQLAGAPWLRIPAAAYFLAGVVGYGTGLWYK